MEQADYRDGPLSSGKSRRGVAPAGHRFAHLQGASVLNLCDDVAIAEDKPTPKRIMVGQIGVGYAHACGVFHANLGRSGENLADERCRFDAGEPVVEALVLERESLVIDDRQKLAVRSLTTGPPRFR